MAEKGSKKPKSGGPKAPQEFGSSLADFEIDTELGRGSHGVVYRARSLTDDKLYVLKRIDINKVNKATKREVLLEVSIMRKLKHPHVIKYYTSFLEDEFLYILMEYADGGDLHRLMKHRRRSGAFVKEDDVWMFAYQLSLALEYLHSQNIVHRDIKCLNVFLTKHKIVKIGDMGISQVLEQGSFERTRVGTPLFLAPELVRGYPYDFKVLSARTNPVLGRHLGHGLRDVLADRAGTAVFG